MADNEFQRFSDRFFRVSPLYTEPGWYIKLREGEVKGPFDSRTEAQITLFNLFGITAEMSDGHIVSAQEDVDDLYSVDSRIG